MVVIDAVGQSSQSDNYIGVPYEEVVEAGAQRQLVAVKFDDTALGQSILVARAFTAEAVQAKAA